MITIVLFLWKDDKTAWMSEYDYDISYLWRTIEMVNRNLTLPHKFVCVVDEVYKTLLSNTPRHHDVTLVDMCEDLRVPTKRYQKLMVFRPDAEELFGERILMMDLDNVIVDNIDSMIDRTDDIVLWENPNGKRNTPYNTSMVLLTAGCRPDVWGKLNVSTVCDHIRKNRLSGTDQAWVSSVLGSGEATWSRTDGFYSFRMDYLIPGVSIISNAKIVSFHGRVSPTSKIVSDRYSWLQDKYYGRSC